MDQVKATMGKTEERFNAITAFRELFTGKVETAMMAGCCGPDCPCRSQIHWFEESVGRWVGSIGEDDLYVVVHEQAGYTALWNLGERKGGPVGLNLVNLDAAQAACQAHSDAVKRVAASKARVERWRPSPKDGAFGAGATAAPMPPSVSEAPPVGGPQATASSPEPQPVPVPVPGRDAEPRASCCGAGGGGGHTDNGVVAAAVHGST